MLEGHYILQGLYHYLVDVEARELISQAISGHQKWG
jgi:hypothetical protein